MSVLAWFSSLFGLWYAILFSCVRTVGPLLEHISRRKFFSEAEVREVTKQITSALRFLHHRGEQERCRVQLYKIRCFPLLFLCFEALVSGHCGSLHSFFSFTISTVAS